MKEIEQKDIKRYIENERLRMLDELFAILRIPSVSAVSAHSGDMRKMAEMLVGKFLACGADKACVMETGGHPAVFAEKAIDPAKPTVLVYGHYDVQPEEPLELWETPPFEPVLKQTALHPEGAIFARGANDDKGQMYMHVLAFEYLVKSGSLPCNVKFLIEGEEEAGSSHLDAFVRDHAGLLACDVVLVSDVYKRQFQHFPFGPVFPPGDQDADGCGGDERYLAAAVQRAGAEDADDKKQHGYQYGDGHEGYQRGGQFDPGGGLFVHGLRGK